MSDLQVSVDPKPAEDGSKRVVVAFNRIDKAGQDLAKSINTNFKRISDSVSLLNSLRGPSADITQKLNALSLALGSIRAPSPAAVNNTKALFSVLERAGNSSTNIPRVLANIKTVFDGFKGPSSSAVNNTKNFFKVLQSAQAPRNLSGIVTALNQIAQAASHANASVSQLAGSLNALRGGSATVRGGGGGGGTGGSFGNLITGFRGLRSESLNLSSALLRTQVALQSFLSILAVNKFIDINTGFQQVESGLMAVTQSSEQAAEQWIFLQRTAQNLGVDILTMSKGFTQLLSSIQGTNFTARDTQNIFQNITQAARVLHLSTDDVDGVFRALTQIISKGSLQSEELRGQLGDRLPGAFQKMATALGVGTAELQKMMKQGEVTGDVLKEGLIKFSELYAKDTSKGLDKALQGIQASFGRMTTAFELASKALGESGFNQAIINITNSITSLLRNDSFRSFLKDVGESALWLSQNLNLVARIIGGILIAKTAAWASSLVLASQAMRTMTFASLLSGGSSWGKALVGLITGTGALTTAITGLNLAMLANPFTWLIAGLTALAGALLLAATNTGKLTDQTKSLVEINKEEIRLAEEARQTTTDGIEDAKKAIELKISATEKSLLHAQALLREAEAQEALNKSQYENALGSPDAIATGYFASDKYKDAKANVDAIAKSLGDLEDKLRGLYREGSPTGNHRDPLTESGITPPSSQISSGRRTIDLIESVTRVIRDYNEANSERYANLLGGKEGLASQQSANQAKALVEELTRGAKKGDELSRALSGASAALTKAGFPGKDLEEQITNILEATKEINRQTAFDTMTRDLNESTAQTNALIAALRQGPSALKEFEIQTEALNQAKELGLAKDEKAIKFLEQIIRLNRQRKASEGFARDTFNINQGTQDKEFENSVRSQYGFGKYGDRMLNMENNMHQLEMAGASQQELSARREALQLQIKAEEENDRLRESYDRLHQITQDFTDGLVDGFERVVIQGEKVKDVVADLLKQFASMAFRQGFSMLLGQFGEGPGGAGGSGLLGTLSKGVGFLGGLFTGGGTGTNGMGVPLGHALGGAYDHGIRKFALGGVVNSPTPFNMGLMGEAGPEGILPLRRTASGHLGVMASGAGGGGNTYVFNTTVNMNGDQGGSSQDGNKTGAKIGTQVSEHLRQMVVGIINNEKRPGGSLGPGLWQSDNG